MKLFFDQNLSRQLVGLLAAEYPDSVDAHSVGLLEADDREVWQYTAAHGLTIVSKDSDFRHLALMHGPPPKVIWLRVGNGPTQVVVDLLRARRTDVEEFEADPALALLVLR